MNYAPLAQIDVAPNPAHTGTSLTLDRNRSDRFPATPFTALVCSEAVVPDLGVNAEEVRVTDINADVITFQRGALAIDIDAGMVLYLLREVESYDQGESVTLTEVFSASNPPYAFLSRRPDGTSGSASATNVGNGSASYTFRPNQPGRWFYRFDGVDETGPDRSFYARYSDVL